MRLFRMADAYGLAREVDPLTREIQYCPDCKTIVSINEFCCGLAKTYREKSDVN